MSLMKLEKTQIEILFENASQAMADLVHGLEELGVWPTSGWIYELEQATQYVEVNWRGLNLNVPTYYLEFWPRRLPMFLAQVYECDEQAALEFVRRIEDTGGTVRDAQMTVECNYPGCRNEKTIPFKSPDEMLEAKERANNEVWYCHHHRRLAWERHRDLPDYMLDMMAKIKQEPGINMTNVGGSRNELDFLQSIGLIKIEIHTNGHGKRITYQHFLTEAGVELFAPVDA